MKTKNQKQTNTPDASTVFERRLILAASALLILTLTIPAIV